MSGNDGLPLVSLISTGGGGDDRHSDGRLGAASVVALIVVGIVALLLVNTHRSSNPVPPDVADPAFEPVGGHERPVGEWGLMSDDLGLVNLAPSTAGLHVVFAVSLINSSDEVRTVDTIDFRYEAIDTSQACLSPTTTYRIDDELMVHHVGLAEPEGLSGSGRMDGATTRITGNAYHWCGEIRLALQVPVSIGIDSQSGATFSIEIPQDLRTLDIEETSFVRPGGYEVDRESELYSEPALRIDVETPPHFYVAASFVMSTSHEGEACVFRRIDSGEVTPPFEHEDGSMHVRVTKELTPPDQACSTR